MPYNFQHRLLQVDMSNFSMPVFWDDVNEGGGAGQLESTGLFLSQRPPNTMQLSGQHPAMNNNSNNNSNPSFAMASAAADDALRGLGEENDGDNGAMGSGGDGLTPMWSDEAMGPGAGEWAPLSRVNSGIPQGNEVLTNC